MDFDITKFEPISPQPYGQILNGNMFKFREIKNPTKVYTLCVFDGAYSINLIQKHLHCQSLTQGIVQVKGFKSMNSIDGIGLPIQRSNMLTEEIQCTLVNDCMSYNEEYPELPQLLYDIGECLAELQRQDIALPFLTPDKIVRTRSGKFKIFDVSNADNVMGMQSSIQREIKGDHHYMDLDTFRASLEGQSFLVQNYFKSVVYSFGLILLEVATQKFNAFRETADQIEQMVSNISPKYGHQISELVNQMVQKHRKDRPDCLMLWERIQHLDVSQLEPPKLYLNTKDNLSQFTTSQPLGSAINWEKSQFHQSDQFSKNSSGIKIPESIRQQIKMYQKILVRPTTLQNTERFEDLYEYTNEESSSDYIEHSDYNTLQYYRLQEILKHITLIPAIPSQYIEIDKSQALDQRQRVYRCKFKEKTDKVVKIITMIPNTQVLQMLINITQIQQLGIEGICSYEGFILEEAEQPEISNLYLVTQSIVCDLERAIRQKMLSDKDKYDICNQICQVLMRLNSLFIHGNLKPSNILLSPNVWKVQITDYGLSGIVRQEMLTSTQTLGMYSPPEQVLFGKFEKSSDIWSFGLIIYELFTGNLIDQETIQKYGLVSPDKKGALYPEKLQNQKLAVLIRNMTHFDPNQRININQVAALLQESQKYLLETQKFQKHTPKKSDSAAKLTIVPPTSRHEPRNNTNLGFYVKGNQINFQSPNAKFKK